MARRDDRPVEFDVPPFRKEELYHVRDGKIAVLLSGRLRVLHEKYPRLSILTEIVSETPERSVVKARIVVPFPEGTMEFNGQGAADIIGDSTLKDSLLETAESRAVARASRFAGIGMEFNDESEMQRNNYGPGSDRPPERIGRDPERAAPPSGGWNGGASKPSAPPANGNTNGHAQQSVRVALAKLVGCVKPNEPTAEEKHTLRALLEKIIPGKDGVAKLTEAELEAVRLCAAVMPNVGMKVQAANDWVTGTWGLPPFHKMSVADARRGFEEIARLSGETVVKNSDGTVNTTTAGSDPF